MWLLVALREGVTGYVVAEWQSGTPAGSTLADMSAISTECYARFKHLANVLERFPPAVIEVQATLPALLDGSCPVVLTHSDIFFFMDVAD